MLAEEESKPAAKASGLGELVCKGIFTNRPSKVPTHPEDGTYEIPSAKTSVTHRTAEPVGELISKFRTAGNDFYRANRFADADVAYSEAIRLANEQVERSLAGTAREQSAW